MDSEKSLSVVAERKQITCFWYLSQKYILLFLVIAQFIPLNQRIIYTYSIVFLQFPVVASSVVTYLLETFYTKTQKDILTYKHCIIM